MKKTTHILFTIYLFLVIWIILFKLSVSIDQLPHFRSINLIPFYYPNKTTYQIREVLDNLIIFIPLIVSIIVCLSMKGKMRTAIKQKKADDYIPCNGVTLTRQYENYLTTTREKKRR